MNRSFARRRGLWTALLAVAITLTGVSAAQASFVEITNGYHLRYTGDAGEANDLTIEEGRGPKVPSLGGATPAIPMHGFWIQDPGATIRVGNGCQLAAPDGTPSGQARQHAFCGFADGVAYLIADFGDGDDELGDYPDALAVSALGGPGNDTIGNANRYGYVDGGDGNDTLSAGGTSTLAVGGLGNDTIRASGNTGHHLLGDDGDDQLIGAGGFDVVVGGSGNDTIHGGGAGDVLQGEAGNDVIQGDGHNDMIDGGDGDDTLKGTDGDDNLVGAAGADVLIGNNGQDIADYSARTAAVSLSVDGLGNDGETLEGDNIDGTVETLRGGSDADVLTGSATGETFDGGPGADQMIGAGGADTVDYSSRTGTVSVTLDLLADDGESGEGDLADVENITGGSGNDVLTGGADANRIDGGAGDDQIEGGAGDDSVKGGLGADVLSGGDGYDFADYTGRVNPTNFAAGVDVSLDGVANDGASGEGDNADATFELLRGGPGNDTLTGGPGNERIEGGFGQDVLDGAAGNDDLEAGEGADDISGGDGTDTVHYGHRTEALGLRLDGQANDGSSLDHVTIAGTPRRDNIASSVEIVLSGNNSDTITGGLGDEVLIGNGGQDTIRGGDGNDVLDGGNDNDDLNGELGDDRLEGGAGTDVLRSRSTDDTQEEGADIVNCGHGYDSYYPGLIDIINPDCDWLR